MTLFSEHGRASWLRRLMREIRPQTQAVVPVVVPVVSGSPLTITVDSTKAGTADTSNFVMLFSTTNALFKSVANGGTVGTVNDFRFASDSAGSSLLTWRVVQWDAATGLLVAQVNIGTLTHSASAVRYILFDGTSRGSFLGGSLGAEYDANYKTVIDGGDGTTLDLHDRTTSANDGTNHSATAIAGPNGLGGINFATSTTQYVSTPNTINYALATLEALVYVVPPASGSTSIAGIVQGNGGITAEKDLSLESGGHIRWYVYDGNIKTILSASAPTANQWHYIVGRADGTNSQIWIDGAQDATTAAGNTYTSYTAAGLEINGSYNGADGHSSTYGAARVALVRLSNVARSNSYLIATSNSYLSPSTFYTVT